MTVENLNGVLVRFIRQSVVPTIPVGLQRGLLTAFASIMEVRPQMAQDLLNQLPFLNTFGIMKEGEVDVDLAETAIRGFFQGGNTYTLKLAGGEWTMDEKDAQNFCQLLAPYKSTVMANPVNPQG